MRVMVIGSGGREHAIVKALKKNTEITHLYCLPGNGGIAADAVCVPVGAKDIDGVVRFAREESIDFAVVAPDDPLVLGMVDALHAEGVACFGPEAKAAIIEGSKSFAKELMRKYGIPTAGYRVFTVFDEALQYARVCPLPVVVKADGLALGKGVVICATRAEAEAAVRAMMVEGAFGASGNTVVFEEFLEGPEVSVLAFTDGKCVKPMVSSMDHKRALDGDMGLNTGGMGAIAPNPYYTKEIADACMREIFLPTVEAMRAEGRPFKGCLYFGLMLTKDGPKVIEYNCRFGDPETQTVLPLLESDLFTIMRAVEQERLAETDVRFSGGACCCVAVVSGGYPQKHETGKLVSIGDIPEGAIVYHAGTKLAEDGSVRTSGGRVLGVAATGASLSDAIAASYAAADSVSFEGMYRRADIGQKALRAPRGE